MRAAFALFRDYLLARGEFTEADFNLIERRFTPKTYGAGDFLHRAGEIATHAAFVTSGLLRSYVMDDKGNEHIVQFAPETWWLADPPSAESKTPSRYFFHAIEKSDVLLIEPAAHGEIVHQVPAYAAAYQKGLQKRIAAKDARIVRSMASTAEERYLDFLETYKTVVNRVPQWMLASYLGVTPETISRIRRKLARKGR